MYVILVHTSNTLMGVTYNALSRKYLFSFLSEEKQYLKQKCLINIKIHFHLQSKKLHRFKNYPKSILPFLIGFFFFYLNRTTLETWPIH